MKNQSIVAGLFLPLLFAITGCLGDTQPDQSGNWANFTMNSRLELIVKEGAAAKGGVSIFRNGDPTAIATTDVNGKAELSGLSEGNLLTLKLNGYHDLKITLMDVIELGKLQVSIQSSASTTPGENQTIKGAITTTGTPDWTKVKVRDFSDHDPGMSPDANGAFSFNSGFKKGEPNKLEFRLPNALIKVILEGSQGEIEVNVFVEDKGLGI